MLEDAIFCKFKEKNAIKFYDSPQNCVLITYGELWSSMKKIADVIREQNHVGRWIGVKLPHSVALIAVIASIIKSRNSFFCLDPQLPTKETTFSRECAAIFYAADEEPCEGYIPLLSIRVASTKLTLAISPSSEDCMRTSAGFCVHTSGSTGPPKTVFVPQECILPNASVLSERFQVSDGDVIFASSPPTFDPFVLDVLLALRNGATLLLVANELRLSATRLLPLLFPGVTIMQMTPSMFMRWSPEAIAEKILSPQTTLRILVLGGEPFPAFQIPVDSQTILFNIYGITEVSCWSTMEQVTKIGGGTVSLGQPLDPSIVLELRSTVDGKRLEEPDEKTSVVGQLFIGSSTRKCQISGEMSVGSSDDQPLFRATGDLVELTEDMRYIYRGRCCRTIKRMGCRVSLDELEECLSLHEDVIRCATCIFEQDTHLILFFQSHSTEDAIERKLWSFLRSKLPPKMLPDELARIESFPLSAHGKICQEGLVKAYEQMKQTMIEESSNPVEYFYRQLIVIGVLPQLITNHSIDSQTAKKAKLSSFSDLGGSSLAALRLHATMKSRYGVELPDLLTYLLDPTVSLHDAIRYLEAETRNHFPVIDTLTSSKDSLASDKITIVCKYDLGKCIDARPSAVSSASGTIVSVGSHSGVLLTINAGTNEVLSRIQLPDRIECSVSFLPSSDSPDCVQSGLVGCYDGYLYCFNPLAGTILWKYNAGGMIKSTPLVLPSTCTTIIVGSYGTARNLHCLMQNGTVCWTRRIGTKPILAAPVAVNGASVFVATLDGTLALLDASDGSIRWERRICSNVPVFSSPVYAEDLDSIFVCGVDGTLCVHDVASGNELTTYKLAGSVFSSMSFRNQSSGAYLFVGCYDNHVYCLDYDQGKVRLSWKLALQSQIYATPLIIGDKLLVCTTVGYVNVIHLGASGHKHDRYEIVAQHQMEGELFATPLAIGATVYAGCRDNFLYKFQIGS
ncbi:beta-alanine-activating enzyme [Anopheles aquasalis]|uniref:beta-alanine-activating enzyme n=1 Tax=Anopheles aquasalis TaxID=42839 RepID=UPI00215AD022|nr:beta-alanine-activating enzyme [Anopheles aquasalis]